ncbi:MAG: DUF4013 domain-containing protein [Anaerolineae bacterium]
MDVGRSFRALFDDAHWIVKVLLGGVFTLIGIFLITVPLVLGYQVGTIQLAARGENRVPEWTDWGGVYVRGLLAFVIQLVYAIPAIIFACCQGASQALAGQGGQGGDGNAAIGLFVACFACLNLIFSILASIIAPAGIIRWVQSGEFGAAFNVGSVFALIRDNAGNYAVAYLVSAGLGIAAVLVGSLLCGIGIPFLLFAAIVISGNLYGQVAFADRSGQTALTATPGPAR